MSTQRTLAARLDSGLCLSGCMWLHRMACRLIIESVGESAEKEYETILKRSGQSIDWGHVEQFAGKTCHMQPVAH